MKNRLKTKKRQPLMVALKTLGLLACVGAVGYGSYCVGSHFTNKNIKIAELEQTMQEKNVELENIATELSEQRAQLLQLNNQKNALTQEKIALQNDIEEKTAVIADIEQDAEGNAEQIAQLQNEINEKSTQVAVLNERIEAKTNEIRILNDFIDKTITNADIVMQKGAIYSLNVGGSEVFVKGNTYARASIEGYMLANSIMYVDPTFKDMFTYNRVFHDYNQSCVAFSELNDDENYISQRIPRLHFDINAIDDSKVYNVCFDNIDCANHKIYYDVYIEEDDPLFPNAYVRGGEAIIYQINVRGPVSRLPDTLFGVPCTAVTSFVNEIIGSACTSLTIPESYREISDGSLLTLRSLTSITLESHDYVFENIYDFANRLQTIYVQPEVLETYKQNNPAIADKFVAISAEDIDENTGNDEIVTDDSSLQFMLNENQDGYILTSTKKVFNADESELEIPLEFNGLPVVGIADRCFENVRGLRSIYIQEYIEYIGEEINLNSDIEAIYFYSGYPPVINSTSFVITQDLLIFIASGLEQYLNDETWCLYEDIMVGWAS